MSTSATETFKPHIINSRDFDSFSASLAKSTTSIFCSAIHLPQLFFSVLKETLQCQGVNSETSSEIELRERDAEGLEGVDGGAVVQVKPIFSDLQEVVSDETIMVSSGW